MAATKKSKARPTLREVDVTNVNIPEPTVKSEEQKVHGLQERALLVRTASAFWHGSGVDKYVTDEVCTAKEAKKKGNRFIKAAMDPELLKPLHKIIRDWRKYEREHTLPWGESNTRLLSIESFFNYKKEAAKATRDLQLAVDHFLSLYPQAVLDQRKRLGKLWRAEDYPNVHTLRGQYSLRMFVEPIPMSDDFRLRLSREEAEEIRRAYDAEISARLKGAVRDVYDQMHALVTELREKLNDADVNVRKGTFEGLRKLASVLPQLNVAVQDPHIAALGNQIAKDLLVMDAAALNDDTTLRNAVKSKADKFLAALTPLRKD